MVGREPLEMPDRERLPEFPPALDLIAPILGVLSLLAAAQFAGGPYFARGRATARGRGVPRRR